MSAKTSYTLCAIKLLSRKKMRSARVLDWKDERLLPTEGIPAFDRFRYAYARTFLKKKKSLVIDFGCGAGYGTDYLASSQLCELAVGLDRSGEAISFARKQYRRENLEFIVGDVSYAPFRNGAFDLVVSLEIIEHLSSPVTYLDEVARILEPQGVALISTPNKWLGSPGFSDPVNPWHLKEYYPDEFRSVLCNHFRRVALYGIVPKDKEKQANIVDTIGRIRKLNFIPRLAKTRAPSWLKHLVLGKGYGDTRFEDISQIEAREDLVDVSLCVIAVCHVQASVLRAR